jgi:site-specific recombinase XerD
MDRQGTANRLVKITPANAPALLPVPPAALAVLRQTPNAPFAAEEFFKATLNNEHTRRAYGRIAGCFLSWCDERGLELRQVTPGVAGEYIGHLADSAPTKNQALAALRHFFDALVQRHASAVSSCLTQLLRSSNPTDSIAKFFVDPILNQLAI